MPNPIASTVDILVIDDDKFSQKVIRNSLAERGLQARIAPDGMAGLDEAWRVPPDVILLDVEMPGLNGYEVCDRLRSNESTRNTPVIFISACSSQRERMLGYEAGADDYMVKPFDAEDLFARIKVLLRFREQRQELQGQYELARNAAIAAMAGSSELSQILRFMENSFSYGTLDQLVQAVLEMLDRLSLNVCLVVMVDGVAQWYSSDGNIKPLEQDLILMTDPRPRFVDFGGCTLVNLSQLQLLVRNMPLDDMERYGRIKDLLPVLLSAAQARISALQTQEALQAQSQDLLQSFARMRRSLFRLVKTLVDNRQQSQLLTTQTISNLNDDLLRMGLEEDQELYLINRVEATIDCVMRQMDAGEHIRNAFTVLLTNMRGVLAKQEHLVRAIGLQNQTQSAEEPMNCGDIELF